MRTLGLPIVVVTTSFMHYLAHERRIPRVLHFILRWRLVKPFRNISSTLFFIVSIFRYFFYISRFYFSSNTFVSKVYFLFQGII